MSEFTQLDLVMRALLDAFPNANLSEDEDGQVVIHTNLKTDEAGNLYDMDTGDKW